MASFSAAVRVEHLLDFAVGALALAEELVQLHLAEDGAQRGLRELADGVEAVLHLEHGIVGVDDAEVDDGVDLLADVAAGDDVLRGHVVRHGAQRARGEQSLSPAHVFR